MRSHERAPGEIAMMDVPAVILVGGRGARFRSVRSDIPKPMAPVDGRPVLEYVLASLRDSGIHEVVFCVGHLGRVIEEHFGDGGRHGLNVRYAWEEALLGTAGAIGNARALIGDRPFVAMNGDTLLPELDCGDLVRRHLDRRGEVPRQEATLVTLRPPDPGEYGVLELDATGQAIVGFREKAPITDAEAVINGGVYVLEPAVLDRIEPGRPVSIEYEVFPAILGGGGSLGAYAYGGFFGDMGTPEGYERVIAHFTRQRDQGARS